VSQINRSLPYYNELANILQFHELMFTSIEETMFPQFSQFSLIAADLSRNPEQRLPRFARLF